MEWLWKPLDIPGSVKQYAEHHHTRDYVLQSNLYMPGFLKEIPEVVNIYVNRLVVEITKGYFDDGDDPRIMLPTIIPRLRDIPHPFMYQSEECYLDWRDEASLLIAALQLDHIDLTNIRTLVRWVEHGDDDDDEEDGT